MAKAATTPSVDRGSVTRAALVRSATDLFVEQGYGAVSVRDLARRTGLTTGAIYGHFRNKADLLVAAISDRIAEELENPSATRKGDSRLVDAIGRQWRAYRSRTSMRALLVEGAAAARVDPEVRRELSETMDAKLHEWRSIYTDLQTSQHLDPEVDMETLMVMLFSAELGLGVLESMGVELPKPAAWERTIERLLGTVEKKPRQR